MPAFKRFNRRLMLPGRPRYPLFDSFSVDAAAGAVNGTFSDKSHSLRTVTDTENKLSISGGKLVFAGGKAVAANDDPSFSEGSLTRAAGKCVLFNITASSTPVTGFYFGLFTATPVHVGGAEAREHTYWYRTTDRLYITDVTNSTLMAAPALNTAYQFAIVLRTSGAYHFRKTGTGYWMLEYITALRNTSALYWGISNNDAAFSADEPRIPLRLWPPEPLAYDAFTRGDGPLGVSDAVGPDGQACLPRTWSFPAGTWAISGNKAVGTPTLGAELNSGTLTVGTWYSITATEVNHFYAGCAIGNTFRAAATTALDANNKVKALTLASLFSSLSDAKTADVMVDVKVAALTTGTQAGVAIRLDSASAPTKGIVAYFDGAGNIKCDEFTAAATWTNLIAAVAKAFTASDSLRISAIGTAIRLYHITAAGVATLIGTATAAANVNTLHGMFSTYSANTFSGFQVFPTGSGNELAALDSL